MNSLLTSASDHPHLPAGLRVEEAVRIAEAITAAHAESTRSMHAWSWSHWERWCHARGATTLPAEPALICAYLTERAAGGLSVGSIDLAARPPTRRLGGDSFHGDAGSSGWSPAHRPVVGDDPAARLLVLPHLDR